MAIDFDLTLLIKETQLQHGLRAEDYARYHRYTTHRLANLRQQLHLSNDRKKFLHKEVTAQNATDERHLMLLALYAERCWAEAEAMQAQVQLRREANSTDVNKPKGGVPPADQFRKRLNKAVKWAAKLSEVADAVATDRVKAEAAAYHKDTMGRCCTAHGDYKAAKEAFYAARETYATLRSSSSEAQWGVIAAKVNELDDRVTYCMQRLGEDPLSYRPAPISVGMAGEDNSGAAEGAAGQHFSGGASQLSWNGRTLNVFSMKVKDALREAQSVEVEATEQKLLEVPGVVPMGQANRVLDLMDRRINCCNDALAHARQDLRAAPEGAAKTEYQLIVHYILFQVARETLRRKLFLAAAYSRRFDATERTLRGAGRASAHASAATTDTPSVGASSPQRKKKAEIAAAQFASPLEVVRLFQAAAGSVEEMELLPGVAGRDDVESLRAVCQAGQLFYTGESWRISESYAVAMPYYTDALGLLREAEGPYVEELRTHMEQRLLQGAAEVVLAGGAKTAPATSFSASALYLIEAAPETVAVAQGVMRFPPDYQAAPCKPIFVDIASTFVDYPQDEDEEQAATMASAASKAKSTAPPQSKTGSASVASADADKEGKRKSWFGWN